MSYVVGLLLPSALVAIFAEWRARRIRAGAMRRAPTESWQRDSLYFDLDDHR